MCSCVRFGISWPRIKQLIAILIATAGLSVTLAAQLPPETQQEEPRQRRGDALSDAPDWITQVEQLQHAIVRLPIAAGLASVLALRPRRRGTPARQVSVIQTQIILAIVGAVVMLVVGSSLARAFGIVGAAGLVRYRSKIEDPKDAGVMLSTLSIGLAAGVGIWMLAVFATAFILTFLWIIESAEPKAQHSFILKIKVKEPESFRPRIEELLARQRLGFELRAASQEELHYEIKMPLDKKTDRLSNAILALDGENATSVEWDEKKEKK